MGYAEFKKCVTPGCGAEWISSFNPENGMCPLCNMKQKLAQHKFDAFKLLDAEPIFPDTPPAFLPPLPFVEIPFAEVTPADPVLEALGRAFDDAIDLAYLG